MMHGKKIIRIEPAATDGQFIASFQADVLGATFAVIFPENLTGAVALHRFTRMIESEYGKGVKLEIDDSLFPLKRMLGISFLPTHVVGKSKWLFVSVKLIFLWRALAFGVGTIVSNSC